MEIRFAGRMSGVDDSAVREILALTASHDIISFSGGNPPEEAFPVREIAALAAEGVSTVDDIRYIERGYENFPEKLRGLGAQIEKVDSERDVKKFRFKVS